MVYFSHREKIILQLITHNDQGAMIDDMMRLLEVSKRTTYRELSKIEDSLGSINLSLDKEGKFYKVRGNEEDILRLQKEIQDSIKLEWLDPEKRAVAILASIALNPEGKISYKQLVDNFQVSLTTIQQDVQRLNDTISKYHIQIEQKADNSLSLSGNEVYVRLYLSQILTKEINEFDFFNLIQDKETKKIETESKYILSLISPELFKMIYYAIEGNQTEIIEKLSDENLMNFMLNISVSLIRLRNNYPLANTQLTDPNQLFPFMQQLLSIVKTFEPIYKTHLNTNELSFFAMQLRGMNLTTSHSIFLKSYDLELGYSVKYLIRLISQEFNYNFNADDTLYQDLISHIGAALKRLDLNLPEMENTVINQLKKTYSVLYKVVEEKLIEVFSPAIFSEQEIGYVVIHFASSFEKQGYVKDIRVLVICASGIGTSKILKARLERAIPEINGIQVVRAIDLQDINLSQYDIVFSTIVLTGFDYDYYLINPILDQQEIKMIKTRIDQLNDKDYLVPPPAVEIPSPSASYAEVRNFMEMSVNIIEQFEVITLEQEFTNFNEYLDWLLSDNIVLKEKLINRLEQAPLVIPNTGIMLLHTTDINAREVVLKLYDLKYALASMGMDHEITQVNRVILMIGQADMDELMVEFLGDISSSIIESADTTKIYRQGHYKQIKNLLEKVSLNFLRKMIN